VAVRTGSGASRTARAGVGRLDSMPLRRRLDILVAAPLLVIMALIAPVAYGYFHTARQWNAAADQMSQAEQVYVLVNAM
jgi:hypothetical protein